MATKNPFLIQDGKAIQGCLAAKTQKTNMSVFVY